MVLDKLGLSLRESLKKIARAVFIDETLISELIKDIQRALLSTDINVQLVFDLTSKIKERALKEKPPKGIEQREYIIKIVYEELVSFLGEEKKGITIGKKKPFKIMMVGLFGSGKCVYAKSKIPLSDGEILEAEEIYKRFSDLPKKYLDDGEVIDISNKNVFVPSFNPKTLKIENKKITHLWKLHGKDLLEINLDNGNDFSVKVTPEHPFFVLREGNLMQLRADELNDDDFVAVPNRYSITNNHSIVDLFPSIRNLNLNVDIGNLDKKSILFGHQSLKELCENLKFKRNYCKFTFNLKKGVIPIELLNNFNQSTLKIKSKDSKKFIDFPKYLTIELAEFLGYIIGDGHMGKNYVELANEDPEIINRFSILSNVLFGINPSIKRDLRTKAMFRVVVSSKTLVKIFKSLFGLAPGKKGKFVKITHQILKSNNDVLRSFLRAYFDCDASAAGNTRQIEIISESNDLIKQINLALMRFGILSTISKKFVNNIPYWRLSIRARYAELYNDKIGFIVKHKMEHCANYRVIGLRQGCGKQDMIPLARNLKNLRESLGFSIGQLQSNGVNSYGRYEQFGIISRESLLKTVSLYCKKKGNFINILLNLDNLHNLFNKPFINSLVSHLVTSKLVIKQNNTLSLTNNGQLLVSRMKTIQNNELLELSKNLSEADVCWLGVQEIKGINNDFSYVYDLTVEDNHSFIADNIIVHNTTSIGKIAKFYKKRGYKVATVALDVHRPAAVEQLSQVSKQADVKCFINKKEKNPIKIYKEFKDEYNKFDILIVDTAGRHALDKELIKELEDLNSTVKPDENLLVISADIGQAAKEQVEKFHKACGITGVMITKLDGTAKGGGSLSASAITKAPVKFLGVGEKLDDIEEFNPTGFVGRLLGMGDLEVLLEKTKEVMTEEEAKDLGKKFLKGEFNFLDMYEQIEAVKKMGPLNKIMELIPGMGSLKDSLPKDLLDTQEDKLKKWKHMMQSMCKNELEDPEILDSSRVERIAKGSGVAVKDVRDLLKQYKQAKKLMKLMKGMGKEQDINKLMKKFKGKVPKGFKF